MVDVLSLIFFWLVIHITGLFYSFFLFLRFKSFMKINWLFSSFFSFFKAATVSINLHKNGPTIISNVREDVKFEWRMTGLLKDTSFTVRLYYEKIGRNMDKLLSTDNNNNDNERISLSRNENAKVEGVSVAKMDATCDINIPSAICKVIISKADYGFSGKYIFQYFHVVNSQFFTTNSTVQLNVVGKFYFCCFCVS